LFTVLTARFPILAAISGSERSYCSPGRVLVGVIGDLSDLLGDCPRWVETFLAGEALGEGDGETRGEAEDRGE